MSLRDEAIIEMGQGIRDGFFLNDEADDAARAALDRLLVYLREHADEWGDEGHVGFYDCDIPGLLAVLEET